MPTRHNKRFAVHQRRQQVSELYLQGASQTDIAEQLGIAQSTVCEDLKRICRKWQEAALRDFAELRSRELQKLDLVEREAWAGWQRSQKPSQSAVLTGEGGAQHSRKTLKNQVGDPRFLEQVNKCILQRRALLGLDMPPVIASAEDRPDGSITLEVRRERVFALLAALGQRDGAAAAGTRPDGGQPRDLCDGDQRGALEDVPPRALPGPDAPQRN